MSTEAESSRAVSAWATHSYPLQKTLLPPISPSTFYGVKSNFLANLQLLQKIQNKCESITQVEGQNFHDTQVFKGETFRKVRLKTEQTNMDPKGSRPLQCGTERYSAAQPRPRPVRGSALLIVLLPGPAYSPLAPPLSGPASELCHWVLRHPGSVPAHPIAG